MGHTTYFFLAPPPWGPEEGSKGQISFNFNYKVNFKDFIPNFVCVLTGFSDRFFILLPGSCPRGGTWGYLGAKIKFRPAVCLFMLSPPKPIDEIQPNLVCELLT